MMIWCAADFLRIIFFLFTRRKGQRDVSNGTFYKHAFIRSEGGKRISYGSIQRGIIALLNEKPNY